MHGPITTCLASQKAAEELRFARERQRLAIHTRQRSLVHASLILHEVSRIRRPLPSEG